MRNIILLLLVAFSCSYFQCEKDLSLADNIAGTYTGSYTEADAGGSITLENVVATVSPKGDTEVTIEMEVIAGTPKYVFTATVLSDTELSVPEHEHPAGYKLSGVGKLEDNTLTLTLTGDGSAGVVYVGTR